MLRIQLLSSWKSKKISALRKFLHFYFVPLHFTKTYYFHSNPLELPCGSALCTTGQLPPLVASSCSVNLSVQSPSTLVFLFLSCKLGVVSYASDRFYTRHAQSNSIFNGQFSFNRVEGISVLLNQKMS